MECAMYRPVLHGYPSFYYIASGINQSNLWFQFLEFWLSNYLKINNISHILDPNLTQ
jgi:hypothetical protein